MEHIHSAQARRLLGQIRYPLKPRPISQPTLWKWRDRLDIKSGEWISIADFQRLQVHAEAMRNYNL